MKARYVVWLVTDDEFVAHTVARQLLSDKPGCLAYVQRVDSFVDSKLATMFAVVQRCENESQS